MSMIPGIVLGIVHDLRAKRLLPVAIVLLVALVAVPVALSRSGSEPVAAPAPQAPTDDLNTPDAAVAGNALVRLDTLDASDLESFDRRNPFKPLGSGGDKKDGAADNASGSAPDSGAATGGVEAPSSGSGSADAPSGGSGSADFGGLMPTGPTDAPGAVSPTPEDDDTSPAPRIRYRYAVDLTFAGPNRRQRRRGIARLGMLPGEHAPLLVYLGVDEAADNAVFLVDASLKPVKGKGDCSPSPTDCATLKLRPGAQQTFADEAGRRFTVTINKIRAVRISADKVTTPKTGDKVPTLVGGPQATERRFAVPVMVDLLIGDGS